jgi:hypothetical protein
MQSRAEVDHAKQKGFSHVTDRRGAVYPGFWIASKRTGKPFKARGRIGEEAEMSELLRNRIKRLEDKILPKGKRLFFHWGKKGETEEQVLRRFPEAQGADIVFFMWVDGDEEF